MATSTTPGVARNEGNGDRPKPVPGIGLVKGLLVTLRTMLKRSVTQQYPHVKPDLPPRTRGVIALKQENCTVCYKCSRECPDWCIYIDAHKETHEPAGGGKGRSVKVLDRFDIDFALCMYCGICIEACPFDALFWSPEFEYSEHRIEDLLHDRDRLQEWTYAVPPPPPLEEGAELPPEPAPAEEAAEPRTAEAATAVAPPRGATTTEPSVPVATRGEEGITAPQPAPTATAPDESARSAAAAEAPAAAAPAAEAPRTTPPRVEVEPDEETYERVLAEQLAKGTDKRIAEGRAKSAAILAARKKAQGS